MITGLVTDETIYRRHAQTIRDHGIKRGLRLLAERFLREPEVAVYPTPIRWLWTLASAAVGVRWLALASLALMPLAASWAIWPAIQGWQIPLLVGSSPLLWIVARRELQDGPVAVLTLVALGFALRGDAAGLALSAFALLATKEVSPLAWPALCGAWLLSDFALLPLAGSLIGAGVLWGAGTLVVFGRKALPILQCALGGHDTEYTREHQSGGAHRLAVDLVLLSPFVVLKTGALIFSGESVADLGPIEGAAFFLILVHSMSPVNNVRSILAADVLLRALAAVALSPTVLMVLLVVDAVIAWRCRRVYDPVTSVLSSQILTPHRG